MSPEPILLPPKLYSKHTFGGTSTSHHESSRLLDLRSRWRCRGSLARTDGLPCPGSTVRENAQVRVRESGESCGTDATTTWVKVDGERGLGKSLQCGWEPRFVMIDVGNENWLICGNLGWRCSHYQEHGYDVHIGRGCRDANMFNERDEGWPWILLFVLSANGEVAALLAPEEGSPVITTSTKVLQLQSRIYLPATSAISLLSYHRPVIPWFLSYLWLIVSFSFAVPTISSPLFQHFCSSQLALNFKPKRPKVAADPKFLWQIRMWRPCGDVGWISNNLEGYSAICFCTFVFIAPLGWLQVHVASHFPAIIRCLQMLCCLPCIQHPGP